MKNKFLPYEQIGRCLPNATIVLVFFKGEKDKLLRYKAHWNFL